VTSTWRSPDYSGTIGKALIVGVAGAQAYRILYENAFAENLQKHGVTGIPSFTVFSSTGMPDKAAIDAAVQESGADTILLTQFVDQQKVKTLVPGQAYPAFYDYYSYSWGYIYSPGYTLTDRVVVMQTNLYRAQDQKMFWTAVSDTTTQGVNSDVIKSFAKAIVSRMKKEKLIR
jgi:hypothetical protein